MLNPEYSIVKLEQTGRVAERERRTAVRLFLFRRFVIGLLQSEPNSKCVPVFRGLQVGKHIVCFSLTIFEQKHKPSSSITTTATDTGFY